jgi:hypothetical protein
MRRFAELPVGLASELFTKADWASQIPDFENGDDYPEGAILCKRDGFYVRTGDGWDKCHDSVRTRRGNSVYVGHWNNGIGWPAGSLCIHKDMLWRCVADIGVTGGDWEAPGNPKRRFERLWDGTLEPVEPEVPVEDVQAEPPPTVQMPLYGHYIQLDGDEVADGFSDAYKSPTAGDILIAQSIYRQFTLLGEVNPCLERDGVRLYRWDGRQVTLKTDQETAAKAPARRRRG